MNNSYKWEVIGKLKKLKTKELKSENIVDILLENRGLKTEKEKKEFLNPLPPEEIGIKELGIKNRELEKAILRIKKAIERNEAIVIYGDYDADGICATAILWEFLYSFTKNVHPYIPSRFEEGYGLNIESIKNLKISPLGLIITVDNGIVANEAVDFANKLGIDIIITDHHQVGKKRPKAHSIIHTTKIGGAGIAWILARGIFNKLKNLRTKELKNLGAEELKSCLELVAIGTIADQLPLLGPNRSFAKYGLEGLNKTKRPGILALFEEAGIAKNMILQGRKIGTYEVNYIIAPRINAMGRLEHAIDSLRLLCTKSSSRARELAQFLGRTNRQRQKVVEEVVLHAKDIVRRKTWQGPIVLAHESYHEGVIGLVASKLVEEFYRPVIVVSRGKMVSKASARSISGFNIIESIRRLDNIILGGGGHPMAAGFSIETDKIEIFTQKFEEISTPFLTQDLLTKKLKIDLELEFDNISFGLLDKLSEFEPTGVGNPQPVFTTQKVNIIDARTVGTDGKHLKLSLEKKGIIFNSIAFGRGDIFSKFNPNKKIDIAYNITEEIWNGNRNLELRLKDLKIN